MSSVSIRPNTEEEGHDEDEIRCVHSSQEMEDEEDDVLLNNTAASRGAFFPDVIGRRHPSGEIEDNEEALIWAAEVDKSLEKNVVHPLIDGSSTTDEGSSTNKRIQLIDSGSSITAQSTLSTRDPAPEDVLSSTNTNPMPQFHFSGSKAGMETVDKSRLERIIAEVSKGNPYYEQAAKTDERVRERAMVLKHKAASLSAKDLSVAEIEVNKRVAQLEKTHMDFSQRVYVCVDMDQFFVGVEMRDFPALRGKPVAVGTTLISTASYEARKYGVRSAMPTFIGRKLCPELVVVRGRMQAYAEASKRAQAVFADYDSNFSMMSLDEAFLDITQTIWKRSTSAAENENAAAASGGVVKEKLTANLTTKEGMAMAEQIVQELRERVTKETGGLTCSAGIAPTRMLAKICSERNKPNGQFALNADRDIVLQFIRALPVRKVPGIGKASELTLEIAFQVKTVLDMWEKRLVLNRCCTPALVDFYLRVPLAATESLASQGEASGNSNPSQSKHAGFFGFVDSNADDDEYDRKSISLERTFRAIKDEKQLRDKCRLLCESLAEEIAEKNVFGRTLTLKLKTDAFEVRTRGETLKSCFGGRHITGAFLFRTIEPLLIKELPICARLMGIRISNLCAEPANFDASVYRQPAIDKFLVKGTPSDRSSSSSVAADNQEETAEVVELIAEPKDLATTAHERDMLKANDETLTTTVCPVCAKIFKSASNDSINAHIDACLNRDVVFEMVRTETSLAAEASHHSKESSKSKSKAKIDSYFGGTSSSHLAKSTSGSITPTNSNGTKKTNPEIIDLLSGES